MSVCTHLKDLFFFWHVSIWCTNCRTVRESDVKQQLCSIVFTFLEHCTCISSVCSYGVHHTERSSHSFASVDGEHSRYWIWYLCQVWVLDISPPPTQVSPLQSITILFTDYVNRNLFALQYSSQLHSVCVILILIRSNECKLIDTSHLSVIDIVWTYLHIEQIKYVVLDMEKESGSLEDQTQDLHIKSPQRYPSGCQVSLLI